MENILLEPVSYYKNQKGKNIRKLLGDIFGKLLSVNQEDIELANNIINSCHNASLVIDDIEDNSLLRRNEPCSHIKYGIPLTLNAGYMEIFQSLKIISTQYSSNTTNKIIEYLYHLHEGQGMDIYYTTNKIIPSLEDYTKMIVYKTGYPMLINLELLFDKSKNVIFKKKYVQFKNILINFSIFYQIRDDYINLTDVNYWKEKGFCQDFDEEKISYLITYFKTINNTDILELLKDKTNEGKIKILKLFHEKKLFDIIFKKLIELREKILSEMNLNFIFDKLLFYKFDLNNINNIL
jgi:geranylgeranyl diphosphate synthase type 3